MCYTAALSSPFAFKEYPGSRQDNKIVYGFELFHIHSDNPPTFGELSVFACLHGVFLLPVVLQFLSVAIERRGSLIVIGRVVAGLALFVAFAGLFLLPSFISWGNAWAPTHHTVLYGAWFWYLAYAGLVFTLR